jgi:hypothetical protein
MIRVWATTLAGCLLVAGFTVFYDRPSFEIEVNDNRMPA